MTDHSNISPFRELSQALEFFDNVRAAPEEERIAVGTDHWDWLESAARRCVAAWEEWKQETGRTTGEETLH